MSRRTSLLLLGLVLALGVGSCSDSPAPPALFDRRSPEHTGITFANELTPSPQLNILNYLYYYNGGGVAAGDVNGNGRVDLYFTANEGPNALYLNQGNFQFKEVTEAAGVAGTADWSTGVTMADINGDGRLDIYVSVVSGIHGLEGHNQLFVNQGPDENGVPQFEEAAADYGLDLESYGTQAAFFDYDQDGDLDLYQLNASVHGEQTYGRASLRKKRSEQAGDRLYRNDLSTGDTTFVEVTEEAGIYSGRTGYGLGVVVSDLDGNGCPDLYVANDFHEHDYLYYNECDGTFTEAIEQATGHVSYSSMGVDAADYNNDGRPDVAVLDMLSFTEQTLKTSAGADSRKVYNLKREYGYHHQLDRNTLQLNQGRRRFSEIGLLADVEATDWSWAPLFADFDNDGRKDLFVSNGIVRRPNDLDYVEYASQKKVMRDLEEISKEDLSIQERLPKAPVPNFVFHNQGDLTFADSSAAWGLDRSGFSNGAAYADLNDDGALDLVVNNINAPASIYENRADSLRDANHLTIRLVGAGANTDGLGAKVQVYQGERTQLVEQMPTRGYQSSVSPRLHVGLGTRPVDSLTVSWPDGRTETRTAVMPNQTITLRQADATTPDPAPDDTSSRDSLATVTSADSLGIDFRHEENTSFNDFQREPLMPHMISREGPAVAVGDVTGNGLDDVYLGGAKWQPGVLYVQQSDGKFRRSSMNEETWAADEKREDVDATFFDANGDGALDLYVVSAGNEFWGDHEALRDRLYLNGGSGSFRRAEDALPPAVAANGGAVAPGDFNGDGDVDLFVGSRVVARQYGKTPESALLKNDGTGHFTDVTDEAAPALRDVGMVTDAVWTDVRGSDAPDLVVVGEWMPITVFETQDGRLTNKTEAANLSETNGWWRSVRADDLNGDGSPDLMAGNLGLNSRLRATPKEPTRLYLNDFDDNGRPDPILTTYRNGKSYPHAGRDELLQQIPSLKGKFPTYESFGDSQIEDLFSSSKIQAASVKTAHTFASAYIENQDDGTFAVEPLPNRAQFAPVHGLLTHDFENDGDRDALLGGNFYGVKPKQGRYDASYGTLLRSDSNGTWTPVPPPESNLYLEGEIRAFRLLRRGNGENVILVVRNNARAQVISLPAPSLFNTTR